MAIIAFIVQPNVAAITLSHSSGSNNVSHGKAAETGSISIIIRTLEQSFTLAVDAADTIDDLKLIIQEKEDIAPDAQKLEFHGHLLEGEKTLAECGIQNGDTIRLALAHKVVEEEPATTQEDADFKINI